MSRKKLTETYKNICKNYFPLFDRKKEWKVKCSSKILGQGFCNDKNKIIFIGRIYDDMMLRLILIHEICHAVTKSAHNRKWKNRMLVAAKQAARIGERELSKTIKDEIRDYDLSSPVMHKECTIASRIAYAIYHRHPIQQ